MSAARRADVFVDLCTQRDYLAPDGTRVVVKAPQVISNLKHLMAYARWARVPIISCVEGHRPDEVRGLARPWCVLGTTGQRKLPFTIMPDCVRVDGDNCLCVSLDLLQEHHQAVFTKHHRDPFTNPKLDRLLTEMPARRFIIFGIALESTVRLLTLGMLLRHRRVAVVSDGCGTWDAEAGDMSMRQLAAKGCELITTKELLDAAVGQRPAHLHPHRRRARSVA